VIEHLHARGFTGIKRGMGLEEIEIDFMGREGLLALDGRNGVGKTSVLDLLHPFAQLASRDGALSNHCFLRDACKELTFTHGGRSYRTVVKIDSESGRSEGFVYVDGSTTSVTGGKIRDYHQWALQTFGSPELFFASLFCSQNSRKLSDMRVGELKALFVEFLRLERYEAWADTSKQAGNILQGRMEDIERRIAGLTETAGKKDDVRHEYLKMSDRDYTLDGFRAVGSIPDLEDRRNALQKDLTLSREDAEEIKTVIAQNALALARRADLTAQIKALQTTLGKEKTTAEAEIAQLTARWKEIKAEIGKVDGVLVDKARIMGAAEEEKTTAATLETLQQDAEKIAREIGEAKDRQHALEVDIADTRTKLHALDNDPRLRELKGEIDGVNRLIAEQERLLKENADEHDPELRALAMKIEATKRQTVGLENKGDNCPNDPTCRFIADAMTALKELPDMEKAREVRLDFLASRRQEGRAVIERYTKDRNEKLNEQGERSRGIEEQKAGLTEQIRKATHDLKNVQMVTLNADTLTKGHQKKIAAARATLETLRALSARVPEIAVAEQKRADLGRQLAETEERGNDKRSMWTDRENALKLMMQSERDRLDVIVVDFQADGKLSLLQTQITTIETTKLPALEKEIQTAREKVATLRAELTRIEEAEKELEKVRGERGTLAAQVSRWRYLQNVCGKNGLQALEIDGAAPLISTRANELLMEGYGPQMTVRIDTQDEEGREDLDIKVLSEHGTDSLKDKSGGEKIWLLHPIRLAMALLSKEKSGREFDVAFMDEIDGPLDREGAATNFMEMYRPFMRLGGIRQLFFITHREACLSYADHVLRFQAGKNPEWG